MVRDWTRTFSTFWTGQALSLFGTQLVQFALVWSLTGGDRVATVLAAGNARRRPPEHLCRASRQAFLVDHCGAGGRS